MEQRVKIRDIDHIVRLRQRGAVPFDSQRQDLRAPGLDLDDVVPGFFRDTPVTAKGDDALPLVDQGDGAVLQFSRGIGFRMNVGDLLHL